MTLSMRVPTEDDIPLLAKMNRQVIEDEGHRNPCLPRSWPNACEDEARLSLKLRARLQLVAVACVMPVVIPSSIGSS